MPEYTKRLVERLSGRPTAGTLVPRPAWPFGRAAGADDPFETGPHPPHDPAAGFSVPTIRPLRPFDPTSAAAASPARAPGPLEPPAAPAPTRGAPGGAPWPPERTAGRPRQARDQPDEAGSGASPQPLQPRAAAASVPPAPTKPAAAARIIGVTEPTSLPARIRPADERDAPGMDAAGAGPASRLGKETGEPGRADRLSPPEVVMPPAAPAEPRLVINRLIVEMTPPAAPPVRTPAPPMPPAPPRPFRAGAPSSALFRRPRGLGQG
jgi:WAS/WASL-interacting protein